MKSSEKMLAEIAPPKLLSRILGRFDLVALYFALIFGSYGAAQMTGAGWAGIPMLLLAVVTFLVPTALASYELGTLFPGEGGIYIWAHKTLGPIHGFIAGWLSWVPIFLLLPLGATTIVRHIEFAAGRELALGYSVAAQIGIIIGITMISSLRLKQSQRFIRAAFFFSFTTAIVALICGLAAGKPATPIDSSIISFDLSKHGAIYSAAILWLLGVEVPYNMGAEIKDHKQSAGVMLIWGSFALIIAYIFGIVGILLTTPAGKIDSITGLSGAISSVNHTLGFLTALLVIIAVASQDVAYMNSYSRLLFVSGIEQRLPKIFGIVNDREVPVAAMLLQTLGAIVVILVFSTQKNLEAVFNLYLASLVIVWVASLFYLYLGLPIARKRYPERDHSTWKIPGGKFGMWFIAIFGIIFNSVSIYYVFALPWTSSITPYEWRIWLIAISLVFAFAGAGIFLGSKRRVEKLDLQKEMAKYIDEVENKS